MVAASWQVDQWWSSKYDDPDMMIQVTCFDLIESSSFSYT